MKKKIKWLVVFICVTLFAGSPIRAISAEKDFPRRPINLYVGYSAGGMTSIVARIIGSKANEILGQPVVVINKPGASATTSVDYMLRQKPDGYSLVMTNIVNSVTALLFMDVPYKTEDLEYLGMLGTEYQALIVSSNSQWKTLEELVDYAKGHPGELKYPSLGYASSAHVIMEIFNKVAGIKTVHVPMKSGPEMLASILGGHCHLALEYIPEVISAKEGGRIRFLASAADERLKEIPDVPTFKEKGYEGIGYSLYFGAAGPKGMPQEVSSKLKETFRIVFQDKEVITMVEKFGITPHYKSSEELTKWLLSEKERLRKVLTEIGFKLVAEK